MKRLLSIVLVFAFILMIGLPTLTHSVTAQGSTTVAQKVQNGVTLHCWNWSYANIEANMAKIASQGYSAIQVSPIQQCKQATKGDYVSVWWTYYQPASFSIDNTGNSALGTKAEFTRMCQKAHEYGLYVIVDVVANHMGDDGAHRKSPAIIDALEKDSSCWHDISKSISNYHSRYDITQYCMDGLPDLNTTSDKVQNYVLNFLKECIDAGADGFRFDAVKHIETPDDASSFASDFWPTVVNGAKNYAKSSRGLDLYCYGELLFHPDEAGILPDSAYTKYFSVTDNSWSNMTRNDVVNGNSATSFSHSYHKDAKASQLVLWAESHDNYAGDGSRNISVQNINKTWALVAARADAMGLYLARPNSFYPQKLGEAVNSGWNYSEVGAVNRFHNAFVGKSEYIANENGIAYVERGTSGVVLVNCGGSNSVNVKANRIKNGTYIDQITGNPFRVSGGRIIGTIGSSGIAVVYNAESCKHPSHNMYGCCNDCKLQIGHTYGADGKCACGMIENQVKTVYFKNTKGWNTVNIYSWYSGGSEITRSWPGDQMTKVADNIYSFILPYDAQNVIFNNGSAQTEDLLLPASDSENNLYDPSTNTWSVYGQEKPADVYYLFGYINGKDHACEDDAANMGDYRFENGQLTATFNQDSYVAIKKENNAAWYMTDGWLGKETTSATLFDTSITGTDSNKLYVPGGVELNFTLNINPDGSLTLSYTKAIKERYTVSGSIEGSQGDSIIKLLSLQSGETVTSIQVEGDRYSIMDVIPGTYTLRIESDNRVSREYAVTVISEDVVQNVAVRLLGDVTGDNALNIADIGKIYAHVRTTVLLTDPYDLLCADMNNDGEVDIVDTAQCYATVCNN